MQIAGYKVIPHKNFIGLGCQKISRKRIEGFLAKIEEIKLKQSPLFAVDTFTTKAVSEAVQQEFFSRGYVWFHDSSQNIISTSRYIHSLSKKRITHSHYPGARVVSLNTFLKKEFVYYRKLNFNKAGIDIHSEEISVKQIRQILKMMDAA